MSIDLSKCELNQKVVTRGGEIGIFAGLSTDPKFPYRVRFTEYACPSLYTCEGYWLNAEYPVKEDIVEILPVDWHCSDPELPSLLESLKELDALRKENEMLKAQIAGSFQQNKEE